MLVGLDVGPGNYAPVVDDVGRSIPGRAAWMAQQDLLFPWLTALENVALGARLRHQPPDRERALALLSQVGLTGHERQLPATLSGGMRQRVALARTLMEDRPVVVLDEPFAAVDAITRSELQELAFELLHDRTVLLITHDPQEALRLADRVNVLSGTPASLISLPLPEEPPLRRLDEPEVAHAQAELLRLLAGGGGATGEVRR